MRLSFLSRSRLALTAILVATTSTVAAPALAQDGATASEVPAQADKLVDFVGANTGFRYNDSAYVTAWPAISTLLIDSGIRHIRDAGTPTRQYLDHMATLAQHGIRHSAAFNVTDTPTMMRTTLLAYGPNNVEFAEPQNEYDGARNQDPDWISHIVAEQKTLYSTLKGDPQFKNITVLGPAMSNQKYYADLGALDDYEDAGNIHWATCDRNPGTPERWISIARVHALLRSSTQTRPIWTTETGYGDLFPRPCQLPDSIIAKYDPRTVVERWNAGEQRTFFYEFADKPRDKQFGGFGLVRADATPKPQYTALKSMLQFLADPGPDFKTTPLRYALSGETQGVHHTLVQRRDGRYVLMLWVEASAWDSKARVPISVPVQTVTLSIPSVTSAKVYSYRPSWTLAAKTLAIANGTVRLPISDTISFVELRP